MNIFNYWWIMDYLALEWVENWGSVLLGYVAACTVLVTVFLLASPVLWIVRRKTASYSDIRLLVVTIAVCSAVLAGVVVTYNAHEIWNAYQHWYITPLGAPIG